MPEKRDSLQELEAQLIALTMQFRVQDIPSDDEDERESENLLLDALPDELHKHSICDISCLTLDTESDSDDDDSFCGGSFCSGPDCSGDFDDDDESVVTTRSQAELRLSQTRYAAEKSLEIEKAILAATCTAPTTSRMLTPRLSIHVNRSA